MLIGLSQRNALGHWELLEDSAHVLWHDGDGRHCNPVGWGGSITLLEELTRSLQAFLPALAHSSTEHCLLQVHDPCMSLHAIGHGSCKWCCTALADHPLCILLCCPQGPPQLPLVVAACAHARARAEGLLLLLRTPAAAAPSVSRH
jgi:hypothetical protein